MSTSEQPQARTLISIHIHKTAGRTFRQILERHFSQDSLFHTYGRDVPTTMEELAALPDAEKQKIRCLYGHLPFGVHEHLPQESTYITMLRDPVQRVISHYYDTLRRPNSEIHTRVVASDMSLEEYATSGISSEIENGQVRILCGIQEMDSIYGHSAVTDAALEAAKTNLVNHFAAFGLTEQFAESMLLYREVLGWNRLYSHNLHVDTAEPDKADVPTKTVEAIVARNRLDIELYEFALSIFQEMLRDHGITKRKVTGLKILNLGHQLAYRSQKFPILNFFVKLIRAPIKKVLR